MCVLPPEPPGPSAESSDSEGPNLLWSDGRGTSAGPSSQLPAGKLEENAPQPSDDLGLTAVSGGSLSPPAGKDPLPPSEQTEAPEQPGGPAPISDAELAPEELAEARRYGRLQRKCLLMDRAIDLLYWAVAALVLARPLERLLGSGHLLDGFGRLLSQSPTIRLAALFTLLILLNGVVSLPLSFYAGYVLEQRFGLSRLTVLRWAWRYAKQLILTLLLSILVMGGLFWIIRWAGPWWWVAGAIAFFLLSVVLGQLAPVLILPLFYRVEKLDRPELLDRLRQLAEGTGLRLDGIYRLELSVETVKANAALAGLGRTRRVLLGDTLLDQFPSEQIETVFAHELGHHVHGHIRKMLLVGLVGSAVGLFVCDRLLGWWVEMGEVGLQSEGLFSSILTGGLNYSQFPVWAMPMVVFLLVVLGTLMEPLLNALSRWHERQADWYALQRTGNPAAFIRAFRRLARLNKEDPDPPTWEVVLFHSHPPIRFRVELAELFAHQHVTPIGQTESLLTSSCHQIGKPEDSVPRGTSATS
ncbi:MAG: M48 family metallopeptidase [Thermoguttaceae bacterium]|nr:M48 family metallopeptidase [Thermoguttaceae bacterium]